MHFLNSKKKKEKRRMNIKEMNQAKDKGSLLSFFQSKDLSILDILMYKSCTPEGALLTKNNTYQKYFQIKSNDLESLNDMELVAMLDAMTNTARTYTDDLKLKTLTSKTDTSAIQEYWRKQMLKAQERLLKNPMDKKAMADKQVSLENINRLKKVELTRPDLNFYFVIYADNLQELAQKEKLLKRAASDYQLKALDKLAVQDVLYRCNNMNDE